MIKESGRNNQEQAEQIAVSRSSSIRRSTGPRTQQGKERSKRNSITHGIFSNVVLKSESQADFDALLKALYNDRRPKGALEEVLVNRLAGLFWRLRRVGAAEVAEIRAGAEFLQWDENERNRQDTSRLSQLSCNGGLTCWVGNPEALQGCLDFLEDLKESMAEDGFDPEYDKAILTKLYGSYEEGHDNWKTTLFDSYLAWQSTSLCSDEERQQKGYASPQKCIENVLEEVEEEIQRLVRPANLNWNHSAGVFPTDLSWIGCLDTRQLSRARSNEPLTSSSDFSGRGQVRQRRP